MSKGSSGKLASTTFNTKPDNELAVVDVYESSSSGIENSFQDAYHTVDSAVDNFASIGSSALGTANSLFNEANKQINKVNSILNGIKSGNLNSLFNLTGGASAGLKKLNDLVRGVVSTIGNVTRTVNNIANLGNNLKGGLNNNAILNRVVNNIPIGRQINGIIRGAGAIDSAANSLERSVNRASNILGGDRSSMNSVYYGNRNKAASIERPTNFDASVTSAQKELMVTKIKDIDPQLASAINDLPVATQEALVRGFSDETLSKGVLTTNNGVVTRLSPEASSDVIRPLNSIINSFTGKNENNTPVQDPSAVSALISGVTNIANKAGMKNTFSEITRNVTNKEVVVNAAKPLVIRAIEEGDLDVIIDLSKSQAKDEIRKFAPDLITGLTYNVQRPENMGQQDFAPYYKSVKTAFIKIDPDWDMYITSSGQLFVNGFCINSNSFFCDLIEATLNDRNNLTITDDNRQNITNPKLTLTSITETSKEVPMDTFATELEKEIDKLNKETFQELAEDGDTVITPPDTPDPVVEEPEPEIPIALTYHNEPFLLLASVYIDNSVESEIEKHFPYLNERFKLMGTYDR